MKTFILACMTSSLSIFSANAQSNDTKTILDALHSVNKRLDSMQKQIDDLSHNRHPSERSGGQLSQRTEAAQVSARLPEGLKASPGWSVNVIPYSKELGSADAIFRFNLAKLPATFSAHLAQKKIDDWVGYRAEAKLNIYEPGRYVFVLERKPASGGIIWCQGGLTVADKELIKINETSVYSTRTQALVHNAGVDLTTGNYDITLSLYCTASKGATSKLGQPLTGNYREDWLNTSFNLLVRDPNDDVPRSFEGKELFHLVRAR